ncbi:unnamed protein product [Fusarium graminearum]|nr:unnamed protein product [Fusarium graminearum]CZS86180.1 unnamed protein product [Fusarium graminearum]
MARSIYNQAPLETRYRTATGPRTIPLTDPQGARLPRPITIGFVNVLSRDADSVIFQPSCRYWVRKEADAPDAWWREDPAAFACFKTSFAYEMVGEEHPRIVPVVGQDTWTGLPLLRKPSYGSLGDFFEEYESKLYTVGAQATWPDSRIKPGLLPLAYQWSLQLLSALMLIHSHDIAYGEIDHSSCWISAESLDISLAGFVGSDFHDPATGWYCPGGLYNSYEFSPESLPLSRRVSVPTIATDMFIFGRLIYCIMTSHMPGDGMGRGPGETERLIENEDWIPDLEDEFLGNILHKCWRFEYGTIEELQSEVQDLIESYGWSIKGDKIEGLDIDYIKTLLQDSANSSEQ